MDEKHTTHAAKFSSAEENTSQLRGVLDQVKMIATGGMAHIFRARQPSLERHVVVKKLKDELLSNSETIERFRREAKALASVLHQNVAHVYDFVDGGRESFIIMEYIDGIDLSTVIQKVGHLPPELAAIILLNVAKGVSYIHSHHLIHRDIKPSNIRLTNRGEVKLMDFGIVMEMDNHALTRPGMMVGSPSYLSPEQVLGDPISPKADIFLLGICLYEMLTGSRPFKDEQGQTVFQRIREAKYVSAKEMQSALPQALNKILDKCLRKDPDGRFESVKELIEALERFIGSRRSSHSEDVLLKFLDEEALLAPAMAYSEITEDHQTIKSYFSLPVIGTMVAIAGLMFTLGYYIGRGTSSDDTIAGKHYSPPTRINK